MLVTKFLPIALLARATAAAPVLQAYKLQSPHIEAIITIRSDNRHELDTSGKVNN